MDYREMLCARCVHTRGDPHCRVYCHMYTLDDFKPERKEMKLTKTPVQEQTYTIENITEKDMRILRVIFFFIHSIPNLIQRNSSTLPRHIRDRFLPREDVHDFMQRFNLIIGDPE